MIKKVLVLSVLCFSLILITISCEEVSKLEPTTTTSKTTTTTTTTTTSTTTGTATSTTTSTVSSTTTTTTTTTTINLPGWWVDSTFYEIFVRSFYDSDGDGIGDLNGIIQKLDYLNDGNPATTSDLGVTGIWLMPINPSPSYHGYDITDYFGINPEYGTMDDFKNLLSAAHARGIRVIVDFVPNHCSYFHPWFVEGTSEASPKRDWFIWSETDPGYLGPWGQQVWWPYGGSYYYGVYSWSMPDLNYTNSEVVATMEAVVRYWLDEVGVDGFRLDSAKHIIEEGELQENTMSTHNYWKDWRINFKNTNPEAVAIGEVWVYDMSAVAQYVQGDELDAVFNFYVAWAILDSVNSGTANSFVDSMEESTSAIPAGQFSPFITNHDQDRAMSQLGSSIPKAKAAASLLFISPGTPFIYYGEEIGMEGVKPDEDIRLPMQWSSSANAGFTTGTPWLPPNANYTTVNVDAQTGDPDSLLSHYRNLISLRNSHIALRAGSINNITTNNSAVYAGLRYHASEAIIALVNMSSAAIANPTLSRTSSPLPKGEYVVSPLMGGGTYTDLSVGDNGAIDNYLLTAAVPAYGTIILDLQPK